MRAVFRRVRVLLTALLTTVLWADQARADRLAEILSRGVVRVLVFADVPPVGSVDASRQLEGFDIDLANLVAQGLGVRLNLGQATAANRIPSLLSDRADINIAAMSGTAEQARQAMVSAPYADTSLAVYRPKGLAIGSAADIGRNRVSVARGTTEDLVLTARAPNADIMRTDDNAGAVLAQSGFHSCGTALRPAPASLSASEGAAWDGPGGRADGAGARPETGDVAGRARLHPRGGTPGRSGDGDIRGRLAGGRKRADPRRRGP